MEQHDVGLEGTDRLSMRLVAGTGSVAEHLGNLLVAVGHSN